MKPLILSVALLTLIAAEARAIKITAFTDTDTYVRRAEDIVVAQCIRPAPNGASYDDGLYMVEVRIVSVIKGAKKPGRLTVATLYPMERGRTYLLASNGGSAGGTDFLAVPQLSVVEVPRRFRLRDLDGKTAVEQVRALFDARRKENGQLRKELEREKELLDKAVPE